MIFFMVSSGAGWEFDRIAFRPAMRRKVPSANDRDATRGGLSICLYSLLKHLRIPRKVTVNSVIVDFAISA
jgi:hypothetical protein